MKKYVDPFSDFGFKKLFGADSSKEALIDFLNALLAEEGVHIAQIEYLPLTQLGETPTERITFFDLYCRDADGRLFIVEIQQQSHRNFRERLVYYSTYPVRRQAKKGEWAFELTPVYVIAILNFKLEDDGDPDPVSIIKLVDVKRNRVFYKKLTIICIEMPKFKKSGAHIDSSLEEWLFYLQKMAKLTKAPSNLKNPAIMKFLKDAEIASMSEDEQFRYERSLRAYSNALDRVGF
jgi:predicted transposase/invertase (TIGR01784 family)